MREFRVPASCGKPCRSSTDAAEYLTDLQPSDRPWDDRRAETDAISELYAAAGWGRYAARADGCAGRLVMQPDATGRLRLTGAQFCRLRYCSVCQWRRSLMWRARFFQAIPTILNNNPTARFLFLTLTVRNCDLSDLRPTLQEMNRAWDRLTKLSNFPAIGFVRSTEVTRGEDDSAHPHFHALLMVKKSYFGRAYITQEEWTALWRSSLRADYDPIVHVTSVKDLKRNGGIDAALRKGVLETLKYTAKPSDLTSDDAWLTELTIQTHKLRFLATGGILRKVLGKIEPDTDADLIHVSEDGANAPVADGTPVTVFDWEKPVKRYKRNSNAKKRSDRLSE
jgi:plasmid rolling circle replication initiator protein Rep